MSSDGAAIVNRIMRGEAILLTGAGFSRGLTDKFGDPLPIGSELAESIWPIAFGDEPFDRDTPLNLVYAEALRQSRKLLGEQLTRHFEVDRDEVPARYETWYALPWHRIYTLNVDDGDDAVALRAGGDRLQVVSALTSKPGVVRPDRLGVVHVNGRLADFPNLTFSPWEFADRTAREDTWYQEFVTDITSRPVVVIGSVLDEPPLWHYLQLRGNRGNNKELRPRSWLVSPRLDPGRKALLERLNFSHIPKKEGEFFDAEIAPVAARLLSAKRAQEIQTSEQALSDVSLLVREAPAGKPDYLLGSSPQWGDVADGFAANFGADDDLVAMIERQTGGAVAVVGSAGSGKTTALMKAAAVMSARGNSVRWLGRETEAQIAQIKAEVRADVPDYLFVDDIDRFADHASTLLRDLKKIDDALVVVVAARSARFTQLRYADRLQLAETLELSRLTDEDAEALIAELSRANRLGALLSLSPQQRLLAITKRDDRQLLVTLIEATSGQKFHNRVADECRSLTGAALAIYGIVCAAAWADNRSLTRNDVLYAAGRNFEPNDAINGLQQLENSKLVVAAASRYQARHRVIAESAIDYFRAEGLLEHWIEDLLFLVAGHYQKENVRNTRYGRLLVRLVGHENLKGLLGDSAAVQRIYGTAEEWLAGDPHFWLQRGSFETDYGSLAPAENFLQSARSLASDDIQIDTAWAMLILKKAVTDVHSPHAHGWAQEAFDLLQGIMKDQRHNSPHTFAVYLNFGLRWLRLQHLGVEEQRAIRDDLLYYGQQGAARFPQVADVQEAWNQTRRWILTNAVVELTV
ncbi:ATP-binding protein [uncultured Curtobacterium sp.]|uniref:ATP-binding protein n=1 Tax=uncultured Curtobacterium sp. TaxID=331964 RepID=UPI00258417D7|nr:ATP-binding protein [uncultured Curtobacterium sp.]